jgi:hypothetical protein
MASAFGPFLLETPVPTLLDLNGGVGLVGVDPGLLSAGIFCALAFSQNCE